MKIPKSEDGGEKPATAAGPAAGDSAEKVPLASFRTLPCWKKTFFALITVCLFFGLLELLLVYVFWLCDTSDQKMLTGGGRDSRRRAYSDYPARPEEYIKIAVFGGSAAEGAYAWRAFDRVVEHELKQRFPNQRFYIKNHAQSGYPFHRHQAEHVKMLIEKYDFFLIYCGNNEAENWFDESGYWRHPEYKDAKELVFQRPLEADHPLLQPIRRTLEENSRIYSLFKMAKARMTEIERSPTKNRAFDYDEFEEADAVPPQEKKNLVSNFANDLIAICKLAKKYDKQVLISISATYETWPPCFSYFRQDITDDEKAQWRDIYSDGRSEYNKQNYENSISSFRRARKIDSGVAILNYHLGMSYLQHGDAIQGRRYLRQAIDQDGYYSRSITPLHRKAKELSAKYDHLHNVETVAAFHTLMQGDISDDDLFTDICHPSFLGQIIIGNVFVNKLLELEPFRSLSPTAGRDLAKTNWKALADSYFWELGVTDSEQAMQALSHIEWYFDMAHWTAYRPRCYAAIEKLIVEFERTHDGSPWARVIAKVSRGRLAVARKDYPLALQSLNQALQISDEALNAKLNAPTWSAFVVSEFRSAGIEFSAQHKAFVITQ